ncbi:MAG: NAD(P)-dependent alcohol dehydrogenase [Pseudomonadota bacterium]
MTQSWTLSPGQGAASLKPSAQPSQALGDYDVRIRVRATSLNARDLMIAQGLSPLPALDQLIPLSDGSGDVIETGAGVSRVSMGDRVVVAFNPAHQNGDYQAWMEPSALGGATQGLLREETVLNEMALVRIPGAVSYEQAACLPCASVVAWNALFESGPFRPGMTVLTTGTGNVSLAAVVLAKSAGARVGVTSSSDHKIEAAISLGANFGVNYRASEDWGDNVREETDGRGADIVLENAGPPSVAQSIRSAAPGGRVLQIGWKGLEGPPLNVLEMALRSVTLKPVMVGSRTMLERLVAAVSVNQLEMPIYDVFPFDAAPSAFAAAKDGPHGKVVITH